MGKLRFCFEHDCVSALLVQGQVSLAHVESNTFKLDQFWEGRRSVCGRGACVGRRGERRFVREGGPQSEMAGARKS